MAIKFFKMIFWYNFENQCIIYERSSIHIWETITFCAAQTYFFASRRECINFYRNTTASSLSQPETLDEHRRFPARVVNDASSFNFRYAAFFGDVALSVHDREFLRVFATYLGTRSRLHFRRACHWLSSSRQSGKPEMSDVFSWKISECTRFVEQFINSMDRFVGTHLVLRLYSFSRIEWAEIKRYLQMIHWNINPFTSDFAEWNPNPFIYLKQTNGVVKLLIRVQITPCPIIEFIFRIYILLSFF